MAAVDDQHYLLVSDLVGAGEVVPFLGAGANMCDRPDETPWEAGQFLPSGFELAKALAERSRYPAQDSSDLLRVSQYVDAVLGQKQLYRYLHAIFAVDYPPNSLHGAVDRADPKGDSYVITENDYIDYLSQGDIGGQIPMTLRERMADSHFLFLGYSMRDWNLRVILNRIWGAEELDLKSWAIQREPADPVARKIEETLWEDRGDVDLLYVPLREYVARLSAEILGQAPEPVQP